MITYIRWLLPAGCLALGLYVLALSYRAYAKWQEYRPWRSIRRGSL